MSNFFLRPVLKSYQNVFHILSRNIAEKKWHGAVNICGNGVKPQRLREEEYFGKKETELYEKLKEHDKMHLDITCKPDSTGEVHCATVRDFCGSHKGTNCREEDFFYQHSLEAMQILTAKKHNEPNDTNDEK